MSDLLAGLSAWEVVPYEDAVVVTLQSRGSAATTTLNAEDADRVIAGLVKARNEAWPDKPKLALLTNQVMIPVVGANAAAPIAPITIHTFRTGERT